MRIRRRRPTRRGCHASSRKRRFLLSITWFAAVAGVAAPSLVRGYAFGPPDGYAGDPPAANNCTFCHSSFPLNAGDGDLRLLNAPATVTPGQSYDLLVELLDPGQSRWGFELTVLDEAANNAGELVVTEANRTQVNHDPFLNRDYLKHTMAGTNAGTAGPAQWSFRWIAPQVFNSITFYLAGNAADNSGFQFGDYIYTRSVTLSPAAPVEPGTWGRIKGFFRGR